MRHLFLSLLSLTFFVGPMGWSEAARDTQHAPPNSSTLRLLVLEAPGCIYCRVFRRDVAPSYNASQRGKEIPLHYYDLNDIDEEAIGFNSPITIVPTVVLMNGDDEIGRIPGYVGPENFRRSINHLLGSIPTDDF